MNGASLLSDMTDREVRAALKAGRLHLELGPFVTRLKVEEPRAVEFFRNMYGGFPVSVGEGHVSDFSLALRAPNLFRRFMRRQIVPDPGFYFPAVPLPARLSPLSLEMGMNLCVALQCFRYLIFHAGVVATTEGAIMIPAQSGGGKSTLTAALMENGYRLLSDEFAILDMDSHGLQAHPRPVSLKKKSIDLVRDFAGADQISARLTGTPKGDIAYRRPRAEDIANAGTPSVPQLMVFPRYEAGASPSSRRIEPADVAMRLINSSPNYQIIGERAFHALMRLVDEVEAYDIVYGSTEDSLTLVQCLWEQSRET